MEQLELFKPLTRTERQKESLRYWIKAKCVGSIPYNDETKHLVGTKENAPKYYRYWEN